MEYVSRVIQIAVLPTTEPLFSELATTVAIVDESGGEYVEVSQHGRTDMGKIAINPEEWPALREAIDRMIGECRENEEDVK